MPLEGGCLDSMSPGQGRSWGLETRADGGGSPCFLLSGEGSGAWARQEHPAPEEGSAEVPVLGTGLALQGRPPAAGQRRRDPKARPKGEGRALPD